MAANFVKVPVPLRKASERVKDFDEVVLGYTKEATLEESNRCLSCKKPTCVPVCPAHIDIPKFITHLKHENYTSALQVILEKMPLANVCGRVCPHPCESKCVKAKKNGSVQIMQLKRSSSTFCNEDDVKIECAADTGKRVAVVGSGPAGLSAAYFLRLKGHKVVVFEKNRRIGGMMVLCIPSYRLPRDKLDEDVDRIKRIGVEFRTNSNVENVVGLLGEFDAVFVGVGTMKGKMLGIPGEELEGVEHVMNFLESVNCRGRRVIGKRVAVVGGGFSAMDAVRVARRLGSEAFIVYRRGVEEMPASREEVEEAEGEGVKMMTLCNPVRIVGEEGRVRAIECVRMKLGEKDESGRCAPVVVGGSEFVVECDMVVQAISQCVESECCGGVLLSKWGTLEVDERFETSVKGVFACGDCVTGPKTIVDAVGDANRAAEAIDVFLKEKSK